MKTRNMKTTIFLTSILVVSLFIGCNNMDSNLSSVRSDIKEKWKNVILFPIEKGISSENIDKAKLDLIKSPYIAYVTAFSAVPYLNEVKCRIAYTNESEEKIEKTMNVLFIDEDFFATIQELLMGRTFSELDKTPTFIINETGCKEMMWKDPIGKKITVVLNSEVQQTGFIVGLAQDLFDSETPSTIFVKYPAEYRYLAIYTVPTYTVVGRDEATNRQLLTKTYENLDKALNFVQSIWNEISLNSKFEYLYLNKTEQ